MIQSETAPLTLIVAELEGHERLGKGWCVKFSGVPGKPDAHISAGGGS